MNNLLIAYRHSHGASYIGTEVTVGEERMLISNDDNSMRTLTDEYTLITDCGEGIFSNQRSNLEKKISQDRRSMHDYELHLRQLSRNMKALAKQYDALAMPDPINTDQQIDGVIGWAASDKELMFNTKMIIASDVANSHSPDVVIGALSVNMRFDNNQIKVVNHNRMVTGYDGSESPHPHWTPGGICLGEYSDPIEACLAEGMIVEAIEQLMLHFTSYNSSDGAGVTAKRWVLEPDVENDILSKYETVTHGELL